MLKIIRRVMVGIRLDRLITLAAVAVIAMAFAPACRKASAPEPTAAVAPEQASAAVDPALAELADFMAIPNVASDTANIRRNADRLAGMMRQRGID
ncbi:MAG: hypothetical protein EHM31_03225, partial [Candidatus Aminicenantes bacterium]